MGIYIKIVKEKKSSFKILNISKYDKHKNKLRIFEWIQYLGLVHSFIFSHESIEIFQVLKKMYFFLLSAFWKKTTYFVKIFFLIYVFVLMPI